MTPSSLHKVYISLGIIISVGLTSLADNEVQNHSKYKYGYVISHKGGSTQAHLESRDGNLALGRYYVNLQNGTSQKVTYFADDLGFHSGVSYSSQDGKGSSKTQIAMGHKALAVFGDTDTPQNTIVTALTPTLLFGKKILKTAFNTATLSPVVYPQFNYTLVPGGFFLTQKSVETSSDATKKPDQASDFNSQALSTHESKYSEEVPQSKGNTQTFYPTSENIKNIIKELHIESTTPSIKSYTSFPQQRFLFSPGPEEKAQDQVDKVSSYATPPDNLSYSNQKSIEKTTFADIDEQIISEVQKHAEEIIMKDLQRSQQADELTRLSSIAVTMQPIIVTNENETGLKSTVTSTTVPEARKIIKNLQSNSINSVTITEKNPDQTLEDSGYFRFSLSPSLSSFINVSQTPRQSINVEFTDRNLNSNNSTLCGFNLCEKDSNQIFSVDLSKVKPKKETDNSASLVSDISDGSGTNKIIQTFYPENKLHDERHYITTIDVQKAISLDVNQNDAGSIYFAQTFPFNKIKPFNQIRNQNPIPQSLISNQISVTSGLYIPEPNPNLPTPPVKPYTVSNTATSGLFDDVPNQNLAVLQGLNDLTSNHYGPAVQERVGINRLGYESQLVVPPAPVDLTSKPNDNSKQNQAGELKQVEESIQDLSQQILSTIDTRHEEEQKKQHLVDEERKQYFENLKKVEALKEQNSVSYSLPVVSQSDIIQATASPVASVKSASNVEIVPQNQYISAPQSENGEQTHFALVQQYQFNQPQQTQYASSEQTQYGEESQKLHEPPSQTYQTEIKDFRHEIVVPQPNIQHIANLEVYQKPVLSYDSQENQKTNGAGHYSLHDSRNLYSVDNNIQQSAPAYTTEKAHFSNYAAQITPVAILSRYAAPQVTQTSEKPKQIQQPTILNEQFNTVPVGLAAGMLPQEPKMPSSKTILLNGAIPFDYSRFLQIKQPLSMLQTYSVPLPAESKIIQGVYSVPEQVALPIEIPQTYGLLAYPEVAPLSSKHYHSTLTQRPTNKVRIQPLKPSTPDEEAQKETIRNLLLQPQFYQTYYYPGFPSNSPLQLRHTRKNQISNSDQVRSQSIRRGKSLKNLRIEYGFKPPLRPSVEFSEEVKPSIYGPSVPPQ